MRNLWHVQRLHALEPAIYRPATRSGVSFRFRGGGGAHVPFRRHFLLPVFTRLFNASPSRSIESGVPLIWVNSRYDGTAQAGSHGEPQKSSNSELDESPENDTKVLFDQSLEWVNSRHDGAAQAGSHEEPQKSSNPELDGSPESNTDVLFDRSLSLWAARGKTPPDLEEICAPIYSVLYPRRLITRFENGGLFVLDKKESNSEKRHFRCDIECQIIDRNVMFSVAGEGSGKTHAENAAYWFLISELHERGLLVPLIETATGKTLLPYSQLRKETTALNDVYEYAARFGYIPRTTVRSFKSGHIGQEKTLMEVTICLPQQNIQAAAIGETFKHVFAGAAIRFRQQAESYRAKGQLSETIDSGTLSLNLENAPKLLNLVTHNREVPPFSFDYRDIEVPGDQKFVQAAVLMDGREMFDPIPHLSGKEARSLASLAAGVTLLENNTALKDEFFECLREGSPKLSEPVPPNLAPVAEDCLLAMQDTLQDIRESGLPDNTDQSQPNIEPLEERRRRKWRYPLKDKDAQRRSKFLRSKLIRLTVDPRHQELRSQIKNLPMSRYRKKVVDMVQNNTYSVIIGATGSGKTTQVPQILLDQAIWKGDGASCNIICTQPRRIAASSAARRVAEERGPDLQRYVGHHIRFEPKLPVFGGSITYCTTGILLAQLQHAPDEIFDSITHLIIDEIHERDIDIDFLLITLKNTVKRRREEGKFVPKIVFMSATIDPDQFANYFHNESLDGTKTKCPALKVPGRSFPVRESYLEDLIQQFSASYDSGELEPFLNEPATAKYLDKVDEQYQRQPEEDETIDQSDNDGADVSSVDLKSNPSTPPDMEQSTTQQREDPLVPLGLACATIAHIARTSKDGAILVFLPGMSEIEKLHKLLIEEPPLGVDFSDSKKYRIIKLHSLISQDQAEVFDPLPGGCRKVILSTNIAETSVTIPDVQYVVDSGKSREALYDPTTRISKLAYCWISKSNAKQRAGRAGRVRDGNYYALYTRKLYESLRAVSTPEILRIDLQEVCLGVKSQPFKTSVREFLAQALEPPPPERVDASVINLQALQALDQEEEITALGRLLSQLPVHPSLGKMIILGVIFRCLDPMLIMGAAGGERAIWNLPRDTGHAALKAIQRDYVGESKSEHIGNLNALNEVRRIFLKSGPSAAHDHCSSKLMSFMAFRNILGGARQTKAILEEARLIPRMRGDDHELGGPDLNVNSSCIPLLKALLASGMFPNIAVHTGKKKMWRTQNEPEAWMHPSSIPPKSDGDGDSTGKLVVYSTLQHAAAGSRLYIKELGEITPLMAMLFGGRLGGKGDIVKMDHWLPFSIPPPDDSMCLPYRPAKMVIEFRKALDRVLSIAFRDLSRFNNRRSKPHDYGRRYLADDPVRVMFAERFVEVLCLDVNPKRQIFRKID